MNTAVPSEALCEGRAYSRWPGIYSTGPLIFFGYIACAMRWSLYRKVYYIAMKIYKVAVLGLLCGIFAALLAIREQLIVLSNEVASMNVEYVDGWQAMKEDMK